LHVTPTHPNHPKRDAHCTFTKLVTEVDSPYEASFHDIRHVMIGVRESWGVFNLRHFTVLRHAGRNLKSVWGRPMGVGADVLILRLKGQKCGTVARSGIKILIMMHDTKDYGLKKEGQFGGLGNYNVNF
jgi:hypothetical protein